MNLQKFTSGSIDRNDIFHSSAYARVAGGSRLGATNAQSFRERRNIQRNRQAVRHYGDSMIGQNHMSEMARPALSGSNPLRQASPGRPSSLGAPRIGNVRLPPRPSFREPPTRGYNPFS